MFCTDCGKEARVRDEVATHPLFGKTNLLRCDPCDQDWVRCVECGASMSDWWWVLGEHWDDIEFCRCHGYPRCQSCHPGSCRTSDRSAKIQAHRRLKQRSAAELAEALFGARPEAQSFETYVPVENAPSISLRDASSPHPIVEVRGPCFRIKDKLKAEFGARWSPPLKLWWFPLPAGETLESIRPRIEPPR